MTKRIIKKSDTVFATGVFLIRDENINGGWVVGGFEDDTYFDGKIVNSNQTDSGSIEYFVDED